MTLTEVLLAALIIAVVYATVTLRKRIIQMDEFAEKMRDAQQEAERQGESFSEPHVMVMRVPPPTTELNPRLLQLERELDKLYDQPPPRNRGIDVERKEKEIIGKMVDIFIKEADKKLVSDGLKPPRSGSK